MKANPYGVPCPRCGAARDTPCGRLAPLYGPAGAPLNRPHPQRYAAERARQRAATARAVRRARPADGPNR